MIYLDHAATTPLCDDAFEAMLPFLKDQYANASSSYGDARRVRRAIDSAKAQTAALIEANEQEIYITSGGTESDNWAILGTMQAASSDKNHLIVSSIEHHAILRRCEALEREGVNVTYVPVNSSGVVDIDKLRASITHKTALISVMLANNEVGTIQPVREIAELAHQNGIVMHTDAVQAAGHIPVNVNHLGVDLLSLSAHKFYGPKGVGALYIRKGTRIERLIYGGEQEKGLRAGTENAAGIVGMGKAAQIAKEFLAHEADHLTHLRDSMIKLALEQLHGVRINAMDARRLPGHVHMTIDHSDSSIILMQLDMMGIAASSGSACASGAAERSHVIKAMGLDGADQADLRFTLGRQNTHEDIQNTIDALRRILEQ